MYPLFLFMSHAFDVKPKNSLSSLCSRFFSTFYLVPGSSPGGSRVIRRWGWNQRPGKNLFNYRYIERLETDSVVGKLVEKKRLNNLVYVE